jgi:two-component system phosphate regulon response regulator PhoB
MKTNQRDQGRMFGKRILVLDEESDSINPLARFLSSQGCLVTCESSSGRAFEFAKREVPDLITLDLFSPGSGGLEFMKRLSADPATKGIRKVIVTERDGEADIVLGLELGADDYITKPFSTRVLVARITAVLRRSTPSSFGDQSTLSIHDMTIDQRRRQVTVGEMPIQLSHAEFSLVGFLAKKPGWVFARSEIIRMLQREENRISERSVDVLVYGLRKKLGSAGRYIESVRGVGYRCI